MRQRFAGSINIHDFITLNRRAFLRGLGASALLTATGPLFAQSAKSIPKFSSYPFALGVASGDPAPDGFVIWTKLAPTPLERGGGMVKRATEVEWAVASDERMQQIVHSSKAVAYPELGHAVHVELAGLQPARDYFYQFTAGGERSAIGRARTLPATGAAAAQIRFGNVGCQRYEDGLFTAYRHVANERFDFVFHYGDYIYERGVMRPGDRKFPVVRVMPGDPDECYTLDDYRHRYSLYQLDADLQAAHASAPFVMSFDDHEVDNNWAASVSEEKTPPELFLLRRAAAFQAWYEHMPVRRAQLPRGPNIQMYRRILIGDLMAMNVLDTRQYRAPIACGGGNRANCVEAADPARSLLGEAQERWLYDSFRGSKPRWTLLAQQIPIMRGDRNPDPNVLAPSMDKWDGYTATRDRLLAATEAAALQNLVSICGDVHFNAAAELKKDFAEEKSPTLGVEFTGTSITSLGDGFDINARFKALMQQDPHIRFYNGQRGYVRHTVTAQRWQADYQVLDKVSVPDGKLSTRRSFVIESGRAGLRDA